MERTPSHPDTEKTLSASHFVELTNQQPGWAATLTQPTRIIGRLHLQHSPITHLSPFLIFDKGAAPKPPEQEWKANIPDNLTIPDWAVQFHYCPHLKVATGTFLGPVYFNACGIEEIDPDGLVIQLQETDMKCRLGYPTNFPTSAAFRKCNKLKIALGHYPGRVRFSECAALQELKLTVPDLVPRDYPNPPVRLVIEDCKKLARVPNELLADPQTISLPRVQRAKMLAAEEARKVLRQPSMEL